MEVNDFLIALVDGEEDEEFMSCDEGDEEELPKFSATFEDIFGSVTAGSVVAHDVVQREESSYGKDSMGNVDNNAGRLQDMGQHTSPPFGEVREVSTGFSSRSSHDTQDWNIMSLSPTYNRVSKRADGRNLWSLDEEEEEGTDEDSDEDYEFFDSRSSISRIQSLDAGHISMFEALMSPHRKRSPSKEFGGQCFQFQHNEEQVKDSGISEVGYFKESDTTEVEDIKYSVITGVDQIKNSLITEVDGMKRLDSPGNEPLSSDTTDTTENEHVSSGTTDTTENEHVSSGTTDTTENEHVSSGTTDTTENEHVSSGTTDTTENEHVSLGTTDTTENEHVSSGTTDTTKNEHVRSDTTDVTHGNSLNVHSVQAIHFDVCRQVKKSDIPEADCVKNSVIAETDHVNSELTEVDCVKNADVEYTQAKDSDYMNVDHVNSDITQVAFVKNSSIKDDQVKNSADIDYVSTSDITEIDQVNSDSPEIGQVNSIITEMVNVINAEIEDDQAIKSIITEFDLVNSDGAHVNNSNVEDGKTKNSDMTECVHVHNFDITKEGRISSLDDKDTNQVKESDIKEVDPVIDFGKTGDNVTLYSPEQQKDHNIVIVAQSELEHEKPQKHHNIVIVAQSELEHEPPQKDHNILNVAQSELEHETPQKDHNILNVAQSELEHKPPQKDHNILNVAPSELEHEPPQKDHNILNVAQSELEHEPPQKDHNILNVAQSELEHEPPQKDHNILNVAQSELEHETPQKDPTPNDEIPYCPSATNVQQISSLLSETVDLQLVPRGHGIASSSSFGATLPKLEVRDEYTSTLSANMDSAIALSKCPECLHPETKVPVVLSAEHVVEVSAESSTHLDNYTESTSQISDCSQAAVLLACTEFTVDRPTDVILLDVTTGHTDQVQASSLDTSLVTAAGVVQKKSDCLKTVPEMLETAFSESLSVSRPTDVILLDVTTGHTDQVQALSVGTSLVTVAGVESDCLKPVPEMLETVSSESFSLVRTVRPNVRCALPEIDSQTSSKFRESLPIDVPIIGTGLTYQGDNCSQAVTDLELAGLLVKNSEEQKFGNSSEPSSCSILNQLYETDSTFNQVRETDPTLNQVRETCSTLNQLHETLQESPHETGSTLNQLYETGSTLNQLHETDSPLNQPHEKGSTLNQLHETGSTLNQLHGTGSTLNQPHEKCSKLNQLQETGSTLNQLHGTGSTLNQLHETSSTLNQLYETLQESPHETDSPLNQLHETSSALNQLHGTDSTLNQLHETLQESHLVTDSTLDQLYETDSTLNQLYETDSTLNQLHETDSTLNQLHETLQESPHETDSSLNQLHESLQESPYITGSPALEYISCSHILQPCSSSALEVSDFKTVHSPASVNEVIAEICEAKTGNYLQYEQSPREYPCDIPERQTVSASVGVDCNTVLVAPELLPDTVLRQLTTLTVETSLPGLPQNQQPNTNVTNLVANVDDEHWNTKTSEHLPNTELRQLSTSTNETSDLPLKQQAHIYLSQSASTDVTNLVLNIDASVVEQPWNANTSGGLPGEIYSSYLHTDSEEDNVSEDSLREVDVSTPRVDLSWGDAGSTASSGTHLSDSLEEDHEENVPEACKKGLTRLEEKPKEIDANQAKLRASLSWLLSKVYGSNVPKELQNPFYETAEGQLVLKPVMVNLMCTSELYCQACSNLFPDVHTQWQGHWSIIQVLSRKGIYISEVQESAVTETVLVQTAPFRLKAHLALIDALMKAYISEVASVEKVVKAVRRITTFPASSELPATPEEALVFWVNKICTVLGTEDSSKGNTEVRTKASPYPEPVKVPFLEDLMRDIGDGSSVAAVIAFYRPQLLCIKDLCLKEGIGTADALYNLQQIKNFCQSYFPCRCFHLSYEDLLYTHNVMKENIIAFLADLFNGFEGPDSFPGQDAGLESAKVSAERVDVFPAAGKKSSQTVAISQVTRRSFHKQGLEETASNLGMGRSAVTSPIFHQPLLSKRISGRHCIPQEEGGMSLSAPTKRSSSRRAVSLSTAQDRDLVHKSLLAWQDDQRLQHRSSGEVSASNPYTRLSANVSLDSALNRNGNANSNLGLDFTNLESPRQDYMELESITPDHRHVTQSPQLTDRLSNRTPTATSSDQKLEPLMPALLKPAKEKQSNLSKAEESGNRSPRRRTGMPPSEQTPVASLGQRSTTFSPVSPGSSSIHSPHNRTPPQSSRGKVFESFVIGPASEAGLEAKPKQAVSGNTIQPVLQKMTDISPAGSYVVQDRASSVQAARAAGIPVVSDSEETLLTSARSREGSIASSGEYSDHESQKIHQEYKVRESGIITGPDTKESEANINNNSSSSSSKPLMFISDHLNSVPTKLEGDDHGLFNKLPPKTTTNFAELKRLKDKLGYNFDRMDRSALIYMQSGSHGGPYDQMSGLNLKSSFVSKQGQGQPHSNGDSNKAGDTEQEAQLSRSADMTDNAALETSETNPGSLELQQLRLKLEQKRKDIERKKHRQEAQHNKMRQQLGKAAFMRVVSKHADGTSEGESSDQADTARSDQSVTSAQMQLQARLGQLSQKFPASSTPRQAQPAHVNTLQAALGQNSVIPPEVSAQRFTDWRTQTQSSRGRGGGMSASPSLDNQFTYKDHTQLAGALGGGNVGTAFSSPVPETSRNKAFSRVGMQQAIDNVRNKWFKSDSDLISSGRAGSGDGDADGDSFRLHDGDLLAGARPRNTQEQMHTSPRSHSQSPLHVMSQSVPTQYTEASVLGSSRDAGSPPDTDLEYQVYDSSLHKLNSSLTELQGEIMRLSLQHEQFKAAQSPVSGPSPRIGDGSVVGVSPAQSRPIHGIPQQAPFMQVARPNGSSSSNQQQLPSLAQHVATPPINRDSFKLEASDTSPQTRLAYDSDSTSTELRPEASDPEDPMNISNDGFFVSFGDKPTPKRLKPKLPENRPRGVSPSPNAVPAAAVQTPLTVGGSSEGISNDVAAHLAKQTIVATMNIQKDEDLSDEPSSPSIGFLIKEESPAANEAAGDDEMQKKRIKLIEMQKKRKEELERKRLEKEAETARKLEEKQLKEEEHERKKAEEKARREMIFQQYLQKKQEDDDSPAKPTPKKRDASASKQRPKSMFVRKAMTPEPGALAPDSGSSSQEDLTGRGNMSGRSTPSVMSALRSSFHFRLPQPGNIRKAVSCNTLQGATNGATGPSTYRRPPSPDLNRLRQQRQRGSSQESGSETGSGSNPGSDYAGPKLFVKPSAKSNRHIIVNAISHCCLAGSVNTDMKNKVLEELAKCDANHFLILFRDAGCQYRGLFIFYPETEEAFKVLGVGPKHIVNGMCEKFYKYNSGAKSFSEITSTKHLSVSVDAVVLHTSVWKSGKAVIKR